MEGGARPGALPTSTRGAREPPLITQKPADTLGAHHAVPGAARRYQTMHGTKRHREPQPSHQKGDHGTLPDQRAATRRLYLSIPPRLAEGATRAWSTSALRSSRTLRRPHQPNARCRTLKRGTTSQSRSSLEDHPHRLPAHAGRLHRDLRHCGAASQLRSVGSPRTGAPRAGNLTGVPWQHARGPGDPHAKRAMGSRAPCGTSGVAGRRSDHRSRASARAGSAPRHWVEG
jgi:hypothetical protein